MPFKIKAQVLALCLLLCPLSDLASGGIGTAIKVTEATRPASLPEAKQKLIAKIKSLSRLEERKLLEQHGDWLLHWSQQGDEQSKLVWQICENNCRQEQLNKYPRRVLAHMLALAAICDDSEKALLIHKTALKRIEKTNDKVTWWHDYTCKLKNRQPFVLLYLLQHEGLDLGNPGTLEECYDNAIFNKGVYKQKILRLCQEQKAEASIIYTGHYVFNETSAMLVDEGLIDFDKVSPKGRFELFGCLLHNSKDSTWKKALRQGLNPRFRFNKQSIKEGGRGSSYDYTSIQAVHRLLECGLGPGEFSWDIWRKFPYEEGKAIQIISLLRKNGFDLKNCLLQAADERWIPLLIEAGADVNAKDENGLTPVLLAKDVAALERLMKAGGEVPEDALLRISEIAPRLEFRKEVIDVFAGKMKVLIANGAVVDVPDDHGLTPLMFFASGNMPEFVEVLLGAMANVNICDEDGYTALDYALGESNIHYSHGSSMDERLQGIILLQQAGAWRREDQLEQAIDEQEIDQQVIEVEEIEVEEIRSMENHPQNADGQALAFYRCLQSKKKPSLVDLKLLGRSRVKVVHEYLANYPQEAVFAALYGYNKELLSALLKKQPKLSSCKNEKGETLFDCALKQAHPDMIKAMLEAGADVDSLHPQSKEPWLIHLLRSEKYDASQTALSLIKHQAALSLKGNDHSGVIELAKKHRGYFAQEINEELAKRQKVER